MPEETVEPQEPKNFDEDYVKGLRSEAAGYRVERNDLKKQVEALTGKINEFEDSKKSEVERLTEDKAKLERELAERDRMMTETAIKSKVVSEATKLNIVDPDAAYLLINLSSVDPEDPKSIGKALTALVKEKPYLIKATPQPPTPGAGGPPVAGTKDTNDMWLQMLKGAKR